MSIDTISSDIKHAKLIAEKIRFDETLPFKDTLSAKAIKKEVSDLKYRDRTFPPDMTIFGFLSQVMGSDQSCQAAVAQVIAHLVKSGKKEASANTAAYCKARKRLPEKLLSNLAKESAKELEAQANSEWRWRNRPVKLPDGTGVSMPDTPENQEAYPQAGTQKKSLVSQ